MTRSSSTAPGDARTELPAVLAPFVDPSGAICALAIDHRDALLGEYRRLGIDEVSEETILAVKARVIGALGDVVSTVLIDPAALALGPLDGTAVLMPLEDQARDRREGGRVNRLLDDFGAADAAALGADGCKLLLFYRADHRASADAQLALVATALEGCRAHGLALVVEPKVYRLEGEDEQAYASAFAAHVEAAAGDLARAGADLLKLQFPGDADACRRVHAAAGPVPWTLLGGSGLDGDGFALQLGVAVAAGCRGFIAGRPIWGGALGLDPNDQDRWLRDRARPDLQRLVDIAAAGQRRIT